MMQSDELKHQDNAFLCETERSNANIEKICTSQIRSINYQRDLLEVCNATGEKSVSPYNYSVDSKISSFSTIEGKESNLSKYDNKNSSNDGTHMSFPRKLHDLLSRGEEEGFSDIISWQPHGQSFKVHNPKKFAQVLMKRFFKQNKLTSFQRQLNLYDFSRIGSGLDRGGYYHDCFVRGSPHLCRYIMRNPVKRDSNKIISPRNDHSICTGDCKEEQNSLDGTNREEITDHCSESTQELKTESIATNKETRKEGKRNDCPEMLFLNVLRQYESLIDFEQPLPLELNYLEPSPIGGALRYNSKATLYETTQY